VLLATSAALPGLYPDDRVLLRSLRDGGLAAEPAIWEDPHAPWGTARLVLIRSTWDYAYRREGFVAWAERVAARSPLWNPAPVVRWNTHKGYLLDLEEQGVPVTPTVLLAAGSRVDLAALIEEHGWDTAVIKAAVGQSGRYAMMVSLDEVAAGQEHIDRLLPQEDLLVQRFLEPVIERGEVSLVYIDGRLTHAVRKKGAAGDFRVHDDYGGEVYLEEPGDVEIQVAEAAVGAVPWPLLYARVDLVEDEDGQPRVMEHELVEPELFLRFAPHAVAALTRAVERELAEHR
jgi:glutathione synthase/RimK-type ligase-like ATP-grasp enzyme